MSVGLREASVGFDREGAVPVGTAPANGYLDSVASRTLSGWAYDPMVGGPVTIEVQAGGRAVGRVRADGFRADLLAAGYGDGRCGFSMPLSDEQWSQLGPIGGVTLVIVETGRSLTNAVEIQQRKQIERFRNSVIHGRPAETAVFTEVALTDRTVEIAAEVAALARNMQGDAIEESSIWDGIQAGQRELDDYVRRDDNRGLARFLLDIPKTDAGNGFIQGREAYSDFSRTSQEGRDHAIAFVKDGLVSIAQYLGLERLECAEQGEWGRVIHTDTDELIDRIGAELGFGIVPPAVFDGLLGLRTKQGIITDRDAHAIYAAHRLMEHARDTRDVCEIGGGVGRAAYYAHKMGARRHTMVDLSSMLLFQYFYLRMTLPEATVRLVTDPGQEPADFNLVPAGMFASLGRHWQWDAVLNCDSFPEMGERICNDYLTELRHRTPTLVSINQEAMGPLNADGAGARQVPVAHVMRQRNDYTRAYRFRTWVRQGYAEEVYHPRAA